MYLVESFVPYECMLFIYLNNWPLLFSLIPDSLKVFYNFLDISDSDNLGWIYLISRTFSSRKHTCIVSCRVSTDELYVYICTHFLYIHIMYTNIHVLPTFAGCCQTPQNDIFSMKNHDSSDPSIWASPNAAEIFGHLSKWIFMSRVSPKDPQMMGKPYGKLPIPFPYLWGFLWE